ncbi:virulence factor [Trinickia dinghuensis]|uniref:Virulence factor n=1 Tax=Trinickia dinghuensis TaxID=2291023 RepID=A0A3D8K0C7_9BURK|nr:virulence factor [Trinickia dinghuensis]RDU98305.1 virulence factor [Trinickia dinghuensis]
MRTLISTRPRRTAAAALAMAITAFLTFVFSTWGGDTPIDNWDLGGWMKRLVLLPGLLAFLTFLIATVATQTPAQAATHQATTDALVAAGESNKAFMAQVVGLEWLNPVQRRDYPTEWQTLWTMGLVKPNKNDDMVRTDPKSFTTIQAVAGIAYGNQGTETFKGFYHKYVDELTGLFADRYVMNPKYFYTVKSDNKNDWRELAGIHVEFAIPERLDPVEAQTYLKQEIIASFYIGNRSFPRLWSRNTPPEVAVTPGGANAGFKSLNAALDYLQANPDKSVWVMNWDAPSFPPKDAQINENMVLLFLVGPSFKTERAPLAWIGKAATGNAQEFETKVGTTRAVEAWKSTIAAAAHNANVSPTDIHFVIHDAGKGSDAASLRMGTLGRTLTETLPEFDYQKQTFNTPSLLGEMGAGTALTDVVLAIGRANHLGEKVLVAGTSDAEHPVAVVVTPPEKVVPIDPDTDWFRARGENNAYLPWWGRRYDTDYGRQQGWSW